MRGERKKKGMERNLDTNKSFPIMHTAQVSLIVFLQASRTSSEISSLQGRFWLTAARDACSMSRIHWLMLSMDESHSRWPGALSLERKSETAKEWERERDKRETECR